MFEKTGKVQISSQRFQDGESIGTWWKQSRNWDKKDRVIFCKKSKRNEIVIVSLIQSEHYDGKPKNINNWGRLVWRTKEERGSKLPWLTMISMWR